VILQINFTGPGGITFINPADDPRKVKREEGNGFTVAACETPKHIPISSPFRSVALAQLAAGCLKWRLAAFAVAFGLVLKHS
jgi:hypothetical protein